DPHLDCTSGACTCSEGFADCDGKPETGCEAALDTDDANCGACGNACKNGTCKAGACACAELFADCDGSPSNGCETSLADDTKNCGACGHDCLGATCKDGACAPIQIGSFTNVNTLGLSGGTLYVGGCDRPDPLAAFPIAGGPPKPATKVVSNAADGTCAFSLIISGSTIYWNETGAVGSMSPIVSNPLDAVTEPTIVVPSAAASPLVATPTLLYWADQVANALLRVPVKGGTAETLYST